MIGPGSLLRRPFRPVRRRAEVVIGKALRHHIMMRRFRLIVVMGLRRSGNHVFINWLMAQSRGSCLFFNDVRPPDDPLAGQGEMRLNRPTETPTLIVSYEDEAWPDLKRGGLEEVLRAHDDRITERKLCLVLRDPRNLMASRFRKWPELLQEPGRVDASVALWKTHAKRAMCGEADADFDLVPVWYPAFIQERDSRDDLARTLGLRFGDRGLDEIPHYGHGSSFGGTDAVPGEGVFDRWRAYEDEPAFTRLFTDGELDAMADRLADRHGARAMDPDGNS